MIRKYCNQLLNVICKVFLYNSLVFILITVFIPTLLLSQGTSQKKSGLFTDYAQFKASKGYSYVEIYFSIPRNKLGHVFNGKQYSAELEIEVQIFLKDSLLIKKKWRNQESVSSLDEIHEGQTYNTQTAFYLKQGAYVVKNSVTFFSSGTTMNSELNLAIRPIPKDSLALSDIELATQIKSNVKKGLFVKNGYRIIPNPRNMYGYTLPKLFYYCEIYNLSDLTDQEDSSYYVNVSLINENNFSVVKLPSKRKFRQGNSVVETGLVDVSKIQSGAYTINIDVTDGKTALKAFQKKTFFVYQPLNLSTKKKATDEISPNIIDEFSVMSIDELDRQFKMGRYIANKEEKSIFKKLDLVGKRRFMTEFWRKRDSDPSTKVNEFKIEYMKRVTYANNRFSIGKKEGWRTDRGRVAILYGIPERVDTFPTTMNSRGYEIWYYYHFHQGEIFFVFVDLSNIGSMRLIHSTLPSETKNFEWKKLLY
ncbi:GWxTD domain-containing protein [bacterium]|nr:GWxTD domain-containing protein [bacterium]